MRRVVMALILLGAMGCAAAEMEPNPAGDDLSVWIEPYTSGWIVRTNRPASVALFEILMDPPICLARPLGPVRNLPRYA